ncbi:MAG: hypothetical protein K2M16_02065 [Muribaculaceae bacterium]|nr:hypothetical protein [Muribaculaceae bacterium]
MTVSLVDPNIQEDGYIEITDPEEAEKIVIEKGDKVNWERQFELKDHLPLGYQEYKEYASPMLSIDTDEYDLQTHPTLLWLPSVKFDETGKTIDLKLPLKSDYKVIIEGIYDNGDIILDTH